MPRSAVAHDLSDLKDDVLVLAEDLRDVVAPKVESVIATVAEKAPPAIEHGRAVAAERAARWGEALADRIPDDIVDRLPDAVADQLPTTSRRRGRKVLVLGAVAAGAVAFAAVRRRRTTPSVPRHATPPAPATGPTATPGREVAPDASTPSPDGS